MTGPTRGRPNPAMVTSWRCPVCAHSAVLFGVERRRAPRWSRRYLVHVDCHPDPAKVAAEMGRARLALVAWATLFSVSLVAETARWIPGPVGGAVGVLAGLVLLYGVVSLRRWPI